LRLKLLQHNAVCSIVERRSHYNVSQGPLPAKRKSLEGMGAAILAKYDSGTAWQHPIAEAEAWPGFTKKSYP
jgi:hypothetical protein